MNLIVKCYY